MSIEVTTLTKSQAAERIGISLPTFDRMESIGTIRRLPGFESPRYSVQAIELLETGGEGIIHRKLKLENQILKDRIEELESKLDGIRRIMGLKE